MRTFAPLLVAAAAIGVSALVGCGGPSLLQCRVDAVAALPLEPEQITAGDVETVVRRVKACQRQGEPASADLRSGDAGP